MLGFPVSDQKADRIIHNHAKVDNAGYGSTQSRLVNGVPSQAKTHGQNEVGYQADKTQVDTPEDLEQIMDIKLIATLMPTRNLLMFLCDM